MCDKPINQTEPCII